MTPTVSRPARSRPVCSSSVVFPAPGELIRFSRNTPRPASQSLVRAAISSFLASTLRWSTTVRASPGGINSPSPCSCSCSCSCPCPCAWSSRRTTAPSPAHPQVAHISRHLHGDDPQVLAGQDGHVGAAAVADQDRPVRGELGPAAAAPAPGGGFDDLQTRALQAGPLGDQVEAEPHRVGDDAGQRPDLQLHGGDRGARHALGHGRHHALGDRELVHSRPLSCASCLGRQNPTQQILGSGSPTSRSTILVPPNAVLSWTMLGGPAVTWPITAACGPAGWARSAASAAPADAASTTATIRPSHATYSGSMPSSSAAPRTSALTGIASSLTSTPTSAALAISLSMVATPPRVASRSARTPGPAAASRAATRPLSGAVSEVMSASMSSSPLASRIVIPWSPIGPDTRMASPGRACATPRFRPPPASPLPASPLPASPGPADPTPAGPAAISPIPAVLR